MSSRLESGPKPIWSPAPPQTAEDVMRWHDRVGVRTRIIQEGVMARDDENEERISKTLAESTYRLYRLIIGDVLPEWLAISAEARDQWYRMIYQYLVDLESLSGGTFQSIAEKLYGTFSSGRPEAEAFAVLPMKQKLAWEAIARFTAMCANEMPDDFGVEEELWKAWVEKRLPKEAVQCPSK